MTVFEDAADYEAFMTVLTQAVERTHTRLLAFCLMPNHWHLLLWPREDGELSRFVGWLTLTHTQRWHAHRGSAGSGHVYQGRFKSFPVQGDEHYYTAARYVERNPLRAKLTRRAEDWPWGSLHHWCYGTAAQRDLLAPWPLPRKAGWVNHVNAPQTAAEVQSLQQSIARGRPLGDPAWSEKTIRRLGLESTVRPPGRPKKAKNGS
jgi:putative transposase